MYGSLPRGLEGHSGLRESCAKADVIECSGNDKKKNKKQNDAARMLNVYCGERQ